MRKVPIPFILFLSIGMIVSSSAFSQSDSLATIHFYSAKHSSALKKEFKFLKENSIISEVSDGSEVAHRCKAGKYDFKLKGDVNASISIDIQPGGEYYVEFSLPTIAEAVPVFKQKSKGEGKVGLKKIYEANSNNRAYLRRKSENYKHKI